LTDKDEVQCAFCDFHERAWVHPGHVHQEHPRIEELIVGAYLHDLYLRRLVEEASR